MLLADRLRPCPRSLGASVFHSWATAAAGESAVREVVSVRIRREGAEIACLNRDPCLSQQGEEAPHGMPRHLESTQHGTIFLRALLLRAYAWLGAIQSLAALTAFYTDVAGLALLCADAPAAF